jgi:hypothetical protein
MKRLISFGAASALIGLFALNASASVLYVDAGGTNATPPFSDWSTAATNIQDAVDASSAGDQILVTNGIYQTGGRALGGTYGLPTNRVSVTKPVTVQSVNGPSVTAIVGFQVAGTTNGYSAVRCAYLTSGAGLFGFTLTNGATSIRNPLSSGICGGGVFYDLPNPYNHATNPVVSNCVLVNNAASYLGGGAYGCALNDCVAIGNSALYGGGACSCFLTNCAIIGNSAQEGGGVCNGLLENCTIISNTASNWGGLSSDARFPQTTWKAMNSIILFNTLSNHQDVLATNYPTMAAPPSYYNCCTVPTPTRGASNITNDPAFVNQASGDLRLHSSSPCINAGNNAYALSSTDLDGNPRVAGGTVDIGAYEFQNPASIISYAWLQHYGLPTDGSADFLDSDSDGMNNWQEWRAGTDPTNPASVLNLLPPTFGPSTITVRWQSVSGVTYYLQRSTNLLAQPPFSSVQSNIIGLSGTSSWAGARTGGSDPVFYRVAVQ